MFAMKKAATSVNEKCSKEAKEQQWKDEYTKKVMELMETNFKPIEKTGIGDYKLFKLFKKGWIGASVVGLIYVLNSQYQMGELLSFTSLVALLTMLSTFPLLDFIGLIKGYMLKTEKAFLGILVMFAITLVGTFPTFADTSAQLLHDSVSQTRQMEQKLNTLLEKNTQQNPQNAIVNQQIVQSMKRENYFPTYLFVEKQNHLTHYEYKLKNDYIEVYQKHELNHHD